MIGAIEPNGSTGLSHGDPCTLVIFGASGDLTGRKPVPALFHLACSGCLAEDFQILGVARDPWDSAVFRDRMRAAVSASAEIHQFDAAHWSMFVSRLDYLQAEFSDPEAYRRMAEPLVFAGDSAATPFLLGVGFDELSMGVRVPPICPSDGQRRAESSSACGSCGSRRTSGHGLEARDVRASLAVGRVLVTSVAWLACSSSPGLISQ